MVKHRSSRIPKEPKPEPEDTFPEAVLPLRAGLPSEWNESGFDGAKEEEEEEGESTDLCAELKEQEETLVLLVDHYVNEVERLRLSVAHYQKELTEMERRLHESEAKLARVRSRNKVVSSQRDSRRSIFEEALAQQISDKSPEPGHEETSPRKRKSKQILVIPDVPVPPSFKKVSASIQGPECSSMTGANLASTRHFESPILNRAENSYGDPPDHGPIRSQASGIKRKKVCREHKELIPSVSTWSSPHLFHCHSSIHIPSQHKKKLRCLSLCPTNDRLFITSALDGIVNLWQLQDKGSGAMCLNDIECLTPKLRRWPEDIAWHPAGGMLFAVYNADAGEHQISIIDYNKKNRHRLTFLQCKPHSKGLINNILFMPWDDSDVYFATGCSDHSVFLWKDSENNSWEPSILHRNLHTSAVMGVAGLQQKKIVMSVGSDKRIIGYDVDGKRELYKYLIEARCMSVLPNPRDFNLFMVQTAAPQKQLRLYDIRLKPKELHEFGWTQESSESQSALINQAWSPDGLYIASGSADPKIHIFDIRYNAKWPSQSVQAHQKRVLKAVWHSSIPVLTSISSDLHIGLHQIS